MQSSDLKGKVDKVDELEAASFRIGEDFLATVATNMVRNVHTALDEFLSNSYDNDATRVEIEVFQPAWK